LPKKQPADNYHQTFGDTAAAWTVKWSEGVINQRAPGYKRDLHWNQKYISVIN